MKFKLKLTPERAAAVSQELKQHGISISDDSDLILTEQNYRDGSLLCRDDDSHVPVAVENILYIESLGKDVFVHTLDQKYSTPLRLYVLEKELPAERFIRISSSVIISRTSIKKIRPALSQKFYLTLKDESVVDVTRSSILDLRIISEFKEATL